MSFWGWVALGMGSLIGLLVLNACTSKARGGIYVWRTDKPHAFIGLPIIGRHFAYAGMTNSYYHRAKQQLEGSVQYGTTPYSWSDLRPKRYKIMPLPSLITHGHYRRKIMKALETFWIWLLCPVYNDKQQPPYNLRKMSKARAARERARRDELGRGYRVAKSVLRFVVYVIIGVAAVWIYTKTRG